ncbi:MAG: PKD domain-containing protein, partial [Opitutales bacterium]
MHVLEPFQPEPGYGVNDGFVAVLGDDPLTENAPAYSFVYGDTNYVSETTQLRGAAPDQRSDTFEGEAVTITEYPYSESVPLSPPAPGYTGPKFFGGIRAIHWDPEDVGFSLNRYSGSETFIRTESLQTSNQAMFFFPKSSFPDIGEADTITFDSDSHLRLNGGKGGNITAGHWLVRDGNTFYVSEETTSDQTVGSRDSLNNGKWAALDIDSEDPLNFEIDETAFAPHVFNDITAIGFLQYRPDYSDTDFFSKWSSFDADLAVNAGSNEAPTAVVSLSDTQPLRASVPATFDSSGSIDSDGEITFLRWNSSDGVESSGETFSHTFKTAGNFSMSVTVWDDELVQRSAEMEISVVNPLAARPERVIAAWGGDVPSSKFRFGGNETMQLDLDGDGMVDDTRRGTAYSEDIPLANRLNPMGTKMYGGFWLSTLNGDNKFSLQGTSGGGFAVRVDKATESKPTAMHGVLMIPKEEFLGHHSSGQPVSLREGDTFSMLGIEFLAEVDPLRWLVRDGGVYYVSETTLDRDSPVFTVPGDHDHGRWAVWNPHAEATHLNFDADSADFSTRIFSDITAFGLVIDTDSYAERRIWFSFGELVFEGSLGVSEVPPPLELRVDFGGNEPDPVGNWNTIAGGETQSDLLHFVTADTTPVAIDLVNTAGKGIQPSGASQTWGSRTILPFWADAGANALSDRLWINQSDSAVLRIRNLNPESQYTLEIASSFDADGDAGAEPGIFRLEDSTGAVTGINAHTDENLGSDIYWTSRGPNDGGGG